MAKGIHANTFEGLRPLKPGERIVYYGGGVHIEKKVVKRKVKKTGKLKRGKRR